ncbi:putative 4-hydroxyphenylacetate 3-monooxygenase [Paenibacillus baekrokdamisoli]|uniref:Putative 4-hydroxyphenylacetate 3-monooxygenase n=1 Tax=Paenibacillus baekrokdamisoli TaxID=1712516 RepID=A0A3G9J8D8_9BACL|nr:4-hydroxyphenylacetate 3-monooxygenase, oxygenase component [Paenibacillus baekrokdamisoli]MBB3070749.1 4-hydroxyphenylacetate 3-monooxygenase [Paenibacillus baekrokdamisoli]BBH20098.1 putative 4-hydroxyphenylacetate 3-monooxygenase [Paenibacillus baekrokdamisoli]
MPVKNGKQYIERINKHLPDVRIAGEQVKGAISEHKAFKGLMTTQASMYDMQQDERWKATMSYSSPLTCDPVGLSFMQPKTKKELAARRKMMQTWAYTHHGFLGRAPDYMNTAIMAFSAAAGLLEEETPQYASNLRRYYEYCRENDITLSHVFIQPKAGRLSTFLKTFEEPVAARVMEKNKDGIVIRGAFLLDTQGATSDEILVFPAPFPSVSTEESPYTFAFAVPSNLPGVRFICRESFVGGESAYNYPLSSRFEEMDTLVIFDDALVPWDRVFICGNENLAFRLINESRFHTHASAQIMCKNIAKTEFLLGTIETMIEAAGLDSHDHMIEKVTEVILALETLKALQLAAEKGASPDRWGSMLPNRKPLLAANAYFPKIYPRMIEIIQLIGGSGLIMIPEEKDFDTDISGQLNRYLKGIDLDAKANVQLSRLAWELSVSAFGGRQSVYERFFFGNSTTVNNRLYNGYKGRETFKNRVRDFLS